jgi:hypothetical protein
LGQLNQVKIWSSQSNRSNEDNERWYGSERDVRKSASSVYSQRSDGYYDADGELESPKMVERLRKQVYGRWGVEF